MPCDWLWCRYELQELGETPLYAAASRGHAEVVGLLIEADAATNQATVCTLACGAPWGECPSVLSALVDSKAKWTLN
jgi:hypothetical protein